MYTIHHSMKMLLSGWWFQIFFIFTPTWGNDPIWRAYFSNGLVQPPTSYLLPLLENYRGFSSQSFLSFQGWSFPKQHQEAVAASPPGTTSTSQAPRSDLMMFKETTLVGFTWFFFHPKLCFFLMLFAEFLSDLYHPKTKVFDSVVSLGCVFKTWWFSGSCQSWIH